MPANENPKYPETPNIGKSGAAIGTTANTNMDGTGTVGTNIWNVFTAGADGAFVKRLRFKATGTNVQTVARVFLNNGSTNATAANNVLVDEVFLPATTLSNNTPIPPVDSLINFPVPAGWSILVAFGTLVAAGYQVSVVGGDY